MDAVDTFVNNNLFTRRHRVQRVGTNQIDIVELEIEILVDRLTKWKVFFSQTLERVRRTKVVQALAPRDRRFQRGGFNVDVPEIDYRRRQAVAYPFDRWHDETLRLIPALVHDLDDDYFAFAFSCHCIEDISLAPESVSITNGEAALSIRLRNQPEL